MNRLSCFVFTATVALCWTGSARAAEIAALRYQFEPAPQSTAALAPLNQAAVFLISGDAESAVRDQIAELGVDPADVNIAGLAGTLIVSTVGKSPTEARRLLAEMLRIDGVDYVAPIYRRADGTETAVAPELMVIGDAGARVAGVASETTRLPLVARNGFEVLDLQQEIAARADVARADAMGIDVTFRQGRYVVPEAPVQAVRHLTGQAVTLPSETVWRTMCGSPVALSVSELKHIANAQAQAQALAPPPQHAVAGTAFDLQFNILSSLPDGAADAIAGVEQYIESQFDDPVTVTINIQFASLGAGILGSTGSSYVVDNYPDVRDSLQADMDFDDSIQDYLPAGSTIPVRYDGNSESVTNENRVFVTRADYNATIGSAAGSAASMTFSTNFSWYYGVGRTPDGLYDFRSVLAHEVGHALGFTSGADFRHNDLEMLDLYRFQRSDGSGTNHNPDTLEEFQAEPRMVDLDAPGTADDVNSDLISAEYRMSDGNPSQASHFHDQTPPIGVMDPTLASGQSFYPDYYLAPDAAMFDAIGWDFPKSAGCNVQAPHAEPAATAKNRYMGFTPPPAPHPIALRVRLVSLLDPASGAPEGSPDVSAFEGQYRWVGAPVEYVDSATFGTTFYAAPLSCDPVCLDWSDFGAIQVFGAEILPNSSYEIQAVDCTCDMEDDSIYSPALAIASAQWADVTLPFQTAGGEVSQPDFNDVSALVSKFLEAPAALPKSRAQLVPNVARPALSIDFNDISAAVSAFLGEPYPNSGPCTCPSSVTCGAAACTSDGDCAAGGLCIDNACTDACGRCTP